MPEQSKTGPSGPQTRRRFLPAPSSFGREVNTSPFAPSNKTFKWDWTGTQVTVSEGHPFHKRSRKGPPQDVGGDFYTSKSFSLPGGSQNYVKLSAPAIGPSGTVSYDGPLFARVNLTSTSSSGNQISKPTFPPTLEKSPSELNAIGNEAIARCKPGEPIADFATFLGELMKDGLPAIPLMNIFRGRTPPKAGSGEFLNYMFGIKPIISDIEDFVKGVRNADAYLKQLQRDSGRVVRRSWNFPDEQTTTIMSDENANVPFPAQALNPALRDKYGLFPGGKCQWTRDVHRRSWFSGAFTYFLPDNFGEGIRGPADRLDAIYGTKLDVETLWNIAPWSWAVDWFSQVGDTLSNIEDFQSQRLVLHYGYVMVTTTVTDTFTFRKPFVGYPNVSDVVLVTQTKQRKRANPFGFGVNWSSLSAKQLAIAAALGINRL